MAYPAPRPMYTKKAAMLAIVTATALRGEGGVGKWENPHCLVRPIYCNKNAVLKTTPVVLITQYEHDWIIDWHQSVISTPQFFSGCRLKYSLFLWLMYFFLFSNLLIFWTCIKRLEVFLLNFSWYNLRNIRAHANKMTIPQNVKNRNNLFTVLNILLQGALGWR